MKFVPVAALLLASLAAVPAIAQDAPEAPAAALTIDTPIEALMANEASKAVLVKHLGPLDQHPAYGQFKTMSLVQLQPWSQGAITEEALEKIKTELQAI
jgi:hypothetical protein